MTTSSPLDATLAWLDLAKRGWGLVVVPPHQQREIAETLAARVPGRSLFALDAALVDSEDGGLLDGAIATVVASCTSIRTPGSTPRSRPGER
jgi:hypothetical protein